jgi:hypothetical protein
VAGGINRFLTPDGFLGDALDPSIADAHIAYAIEAGFRIHNSAVEDYEVVILGHGLPKRE